MRNEFAERLAKAGKPCPVPSCRKPIGPNGILCRDHYSAVPQYKRHWLSVARKTGRKHAEAVWAQKCIASARGPS